jgi:hypothetical protein
MHASSTTVRGYPESIDAGIAGALAPNSSPAGGI